MWTTLDSICDDFVKALRGFYESVGDEWDHERKADKELSLCIAEMLSILISPELQAIKSPRANMPKQEIQTYFISPIERNIREDGTIEEVPKPVVEIEAESAKEAMDIFGALNPGSMTRKMTVGSIKTKSSLKE